jgi:hypothetical protein
MRIATIASARWTRATRLTALRVSLAGASLVSLLLASGAGFKWL